jgi:acetyl-CoA C-acetyltransferase
MAPVTLASAKGETVIRYDEQPFKAKLDKIPGLRPAFKKDGAITAATSSSISDGAAALVLMRESEAARRGLAPIARIVAHGVHAQAPEWFHHRAGRRHRQGAQEGRLGRQERQSVGGQRGLRRRHAGGHGRVQAAARDRQRARRRAVALGHPIGASGARIVVTLLGALKKRGLRRGVAALCIGGGEATALAVEMC